MMRVKFYREHKYVSAALNTLERLLAKTDFRCSAEVAHAKREWREMASLLQEHARYEEERLHPLLEQKGSVVHLEAHAQHEELDQTFQKIDRLFEEVKDSDDPLEVGYQLYLVFRKFVGDNLLHLHEEEPKILPELQRLYRDEELRLVEAPTYREMTAEELEEMLHILFPHMNASDKETFLEDIKFFEPEKFAKISKRLRD